jgi:hypothetical protein
MPPIIPRKQQSGFNRQELKQVLERPPVPLMEHANLGEPVVQTAPPPHLGAPANARPFYVTLGVIPNLAAVVTTLASIEVPTGMIGRVYFIEQQVTNFSAGVLEDMVEFSLRYDLIGVAPFGTFRGVLSRRDFPKRGLVIDPADSGEVISLSARVLPTAEGGLDLGTVNAWGAIAGWLEPAKQTA